MLFFELRLSGNGIISCAFCHLSQAGWGDNRALSLGYPSTMHWRNSQTILNSGYYKKLFWAGESLSLEAQAKSAWTGALAQNLDPDLAEERLYQIAEYVQRFQEVFGTDAPRFEDALRAVAAFERTLNTISESVPFDEYVRGDEAALPDSAKRGMALFVGKANCVMCHNGSLFSDDNYHNLGVPNHPDFETDPLRQIALRYQHYSRGVPEKIYRSADTDLGLYYTTKNEADKGKFRTPSLRELKYTGPYMHNGVFETLREVVEFYNQGGGPGSVHLTALGLTDEEIDDLVGFLESLSGDPVIVDRPDLPDYGIIESEVSDKEGKNAQ